MVSYEEAQPAVIDWEWATWGDPAYDLAVFTDGVKRPFQVRDGHSLLVNAYRAAGGAQVTEKHVHLYELCRKARAYRDALDPGCDTVHAPEHHIAAVERILQRAEAKG